MNEESKDLQSIQNLKGVGPKGASSLINLGIFNDFDEFLEFEIRILQDFEQIWIIQTLIIVFKIETSKI